MTVPQQSLDRAERVFLDPDRIGEQAQVDEVLRGLAPDVGDAQRFQRGRRLSSKEGSSRLSAQTWEPLKMGCGEWNRAGSHPSHTGRPSPRAQFPAPLDGNLDSTARKRRKLAAVYNRQEGHWNVRWGAIPLGRLDDYRPDRGLIVARRPRGTRNVSGMSLL